MNGGNTNRYTKSDYPSVFNNPFKYKLTDLDDGVNYDALIDYQIEQQKNVLPTIVLQEKWLTRIDPSYLKLNDYTNKYAYTDQPLSFKGQLTYE